jgi:hypothetical protein
MVVDQKYGSGKQKSSNLESEQTASLLQYRKEGQTRYRAEVTPYLDKTHTAWAISSAGCQAMRGD